ncbi:MAG: hypothetical protein JWN86_1596 [Planctomycetota bacterium]|nr:hypothetical protein [Planctomycetota bacterium]
MRSPYFVLLAIPALCGQAPAPDGGAAKETPEVIAKAKREKCHRIYLEEAKGYAIYRDRTRAEKLELKREPVYVWTNPIRGGEQDGEVYVWTNRGRAEVIGTFFSYPGTGPRNLNHELHSLATTVLDVNRPGANTWTPLAPGITPAAIEAAPPAGRTPSLRLSQMRALARDFAATTEDAKGRRWELRTLPQPIFRYESTDPEVLDGAVFAFVTSAGTDPELLLVLEARKATKAATPSWHFGLARFTDMNLTVKHEGKVVMNVPMIPYDAPTQDAGGRYRSFRDRSIPAIEGTSEVETLQIPIAPDTARPKP